MYDGMLMSIRFNKIMKIMPFRMSASREKGCELQRNGMLSNFLLRLWRFKLELAAEKRGSVEPHHGRLSSPSCGRFSPGRGSLGLCASADRGRDHLFADPTKQIISFRMDGGLSRVGEFSTSAGGAGLPASEGPSPLSPASLTWEISSSASLTSSIGGGASPS
jgi:hypothetical protein